MKSGRIGFQVEREDVYKSHKEESKLKTIKNIKTTCFYDAITM